MINDDYGRRPVDDFFSISNNASSSGPWLACIKAQPSPRKSASKSIVKARPLLRASTAYRLLRKAFCHQRGWWYRFETYVLKRTMGTTVSRLQFINQKVWHAIWWITRTMRDGSPDRNTRIGHFIMAPRSAEAILRIDSGGIAVSSEMVVILMKAERWRIYWREWERRERWYPRAATPENIAILKMSFTKWASAQWAVRDALERRRSRYLHRSNRLVNHQMGEINGSFSICRLVYKWALWNEIKRHSAEEMTTLSVSTLEWHIKRSQTSR